MKKQNLITCILCVVVCTNIYSQEGAFFADIKPAKDTLYPFDILELKVEFKAIEREKAFPFNKSSCIQMRMEEPRKSEWFLFNGYEVNFGGFTSEDLSNTKRVIPAGFTSAYRFAAELSPDTSLARRGPVCPTALAHGKYSIRVVYSPEKLLFEQIGYPSGIDKCKGCIIKQVPVVVLDHYPEKDQPAYEWIKKLKYPYCFYQENFLLYTNEEQLKIGEEFLNLFPESCFVPYVHCKIGDSLRRIYEEDVNKDKAPVEETIKKMQDIIMHLGYYKQIKGHDRLYLYYEEMRKKFQDRLLRFKIRHGLK